MPPQVPAPEPLSEDVNLIALAEIGPDRPPTWVKVVDQTRCIGCHACTTACKSENEVPVGVNRTYVKSVEVGTYPQVQRTFQVTRCNQCDDAPCVTACPTSAMFGRPDGIVDFDKSACIGCKACMAACPYDAIFINPDDHSAEKCNFCAHRLDIGLEPACVVVCPTDAILVGDLNDPTSRVADLTRREPVAVRRPEKGTRPKLFYRGGRQATLDPLGARRPSGGLFAWSEQARGAGKVVSGSPRRAGSSAAALLSYDVPHEAPWDWRVSLYTWTKAIAAGAYLAPLLLLVSGLLDWSSSLWLWAAPAVALGLLVATGVVLIADLEHPQRFYYLFVRPQWRSWLVRGAVIIALFGGVLVAHLALSSAGLQAPQKWLALVGAPLAAAAAAYTAYLFAQARARDLWQSPLLAPHMLLQAVLVGTAVTVPLAGWLAADAVGALQWLLVGAVAGHLAVVAAELSTAHGSAHAQQAVRELRSGRYAPVLWLSVALAVVALFAPLIGVAAAGCALAALMAYEHAYVQAGQAVPLA
ncbi:MAG: polysulfide reductase NrfD [Actinomycetia bacterium]|nr:polysulfide reductase NrfD [Actinomycetes bacterium]